MNIEDVPQAEDDLFTAEDRRLWSDGDEDESVVPDPQRTVERKV